MTTPLSDAARLEHLKNQAKALLKALRAKEPSAADRIRLSHPEFGTLELPEVLAGRFLLVDAQLVIAREYGFASWPKLKQEVERLQRARPALLTRFETLLQAAQDNNLEKMREILDQHPELASASDDRGRSVLARCVRGASLAAVGLLLDSGAEATSVNLHDIAWWNPDLPKIELLLQRGADSRRLITHHASGDTTLLHNAANNGNAGLAELLLRYGALDQLDARLKPGEEGRRSGLTPVMLAAKQGHRNVADVLIMNGAHYDAFSAAAFGDCERLTALLDGTLDARTARYAYQNSLLHWAAESYQREAAALLLDHGADLEARNVFDETPLLVACLRRASHKADAAEADRRLQMIEALLTRGAVCDLHAAAALGDSERLTALLDAGPDLARLSNGFGWTPLHWSARCGNAETAGILLDYGADINAKDSIGCPPLFYAAYPGAHQAVARLLCERGADANFRNIWNKGLRAYDCADVGVDFRQFGLE